MYDIGRDGKRRYGTFVGVVKKNDDPQNNGRCSVWIAEFGGDPDREENWYIVSYASPFAGTTSIKDVRKDSADQAGTQTAYGFWMQPPDLENHVLLTFANGDTSKGYWFACIYPTNMNHAVPGVPNNVSTDDSLTSQGIYPPVVEYNKKSDENPDQPHRPTFVPLHEGLTNQGLYPDAERGRSTSGARREAPSKTFGYSTPRGTSMVVDDNPDNEFIRMRTRGGTQVLIHETSGYVYINSKNGNSWIEVSDEGIDIYSKKSISVRAAEDLNFRADRDIYIEADRGIFMRAGANMTVETVKDIAVKTGTDFKVGTGGLFGVKADSSINMDATVTISQLGGTSIVRTAPTISDNVTPATPVQKPQVKAQGSRVDIQPPPTTAQAAQTASTVAASAQSAQAATANVASQTEATQQAVQNVKVEIPTADGSSTQVVAPAHGVAACTTALQSTAVQSNPSLLASFNSALAKCQQVATAVQTATGAMNAAITRVQDSHQLISQMASQAQTASSALTQAAAQVNGTTAQVANAVTSTVTKATSALPGSIGGTLGGALNGVVGQATSSINGAITQGLGVVNEATSLLTGLAGQAQNAANQVTSAVNTLSGAASTVTGLAHTLSGLTGDATAAKAAQTLTSAVTNLTNAGATATTAANSLVGAAGAAQSSTPQKTTKKTIVQRMPTHEPWPWHVKEGQQSPSNTASTDDDKQVADAAARPGQGLAATTPTGEQPVKSPASKTIQTGTGDLIQQVAKYAGPMLQIGSSAVRGDVFAALKEAASVGGIDVGYMMSKAAEMGFDPDMKVAGASGFMQITQPVFDSIVSQYGASLGIGAGDIQDPRANALAGAIVARDNQTFLEQHGIDVGTTELTLAHAMGAPVAAQFLTNLDRDPTADAQSSVPEGFSRAHRSIFFSGSVPRTSAEVYAMFDNKFSGRATHYRTVVEQLTTTVEPPPFPPDAFI